MVLTLPLGTPPRRVGRRWKAIEFFASECIPNPERRVSRCGQSELPCQRERRAGGADGGRGPAAGRQPDRYPDFLERRGEHARGRQPGQPSGGRRQPWQPPRDPRAAEPRDAGDARDGAHGPARAPAPPSEQVHVRDPRGRHEPVAAAARSALQGDGSGPDAPDERREPPRAPAGPPPGRGIREDHEARAPGRVDGGERGGSASSWEESGSSEVTVPTAASGPIRRSGAMCADAASTAAFVPRTSLTLMNLVKILKKLLTMRQPTWRAARAAVELTDPV